MEWLLKILTDNGVQNVDSIVNSIKRELPLYFVAKSDFNERGDTIKKLQDDLKQRDKDLETLKKSAGDNETLKQQLNDLQTKYDADTQKIAAEMQEQRLNNAIRLNLVGKVHDENLVMNLFDKSKIELNEDGSIKLGFKEQFESMQKDKAFLFKAEQKPQVKGVTPYESNSDDKGIQDTDSSIAIAKQAAQSTVAKEATSANDYYFKKS